MAKKSTAAPAADKPKPATKPKPAAKGTKFDIVLKCDAVVQGAPRGIHTSLGVLTLNSLGLEQFVQFYREGFIGADDNGKLTVRRDGHNLKAGDDVGTFNKSKECDSLNYVCAALAGGLACEKK